ncbi:DUF3305 domain-containing protein [Falsiroseomonas bella]|uniref:DUF3305 domain-containing protein n=1 Tax=Falsiroseomonas bella TaxID=2184016 RepID=A0A317FCJ4_9PROT|nr:DUF3305 domain-containing protein [Falsiroseomonas bella]PWS35679.1 DUF3305 domain-containing protein [Falsiroseomonas bella]
MNPDSLAVPVAVLAERRPGVTRWAEHVWQVVEVLEDAPPVPPWTLLREEAGRSLFFAGAAEVALHPTDTDNYKHNLEAAEPLVWVALRPAETPSGFLLQAVTVDPGEAHLYADVGADLLEALPMPPGLRAVTAEFVARHHKEREFHKRRRDRADPEALGRRRPGTAEP